MVAVADPADAGVDALDVWDAGLVAEGEGFGLALVVRRAQAWAVRLGSRTVMGR